jgi:putative transposase
MQPVERHVIKRADPRFAAIDTAAFASKKLYNAASYVVRQSFIAEAVCLNYHGLRQRMKDHEAYQALPAKVARRILRLLGTNSQSFFAALTAWQADPSHFLGRPRLPRYNVKYKRRNLLVYTTQALSIPALRSGLMVPSTLGVNVRTRQRHETIQPVRIVPRKSFYVMEVTCERAAAPAAVNPASHAGVDVGLNNLAAIASDKAGFIPRLVSGRRVESINRFYNKRRAELQSRPGEAHTNWCLERCATKRTRRIERYLHTACRLIIDLLLAEEIGTLCIGQNPLWKQEANLGRRANQNLVLVPRARLIAMLTCKAELVGIQAGITEESSISKASFLDADPLPVYAPTQPAPAFRGCRVKRGLYRAADGRHISADANDACNIMDTVGPDPFARGRRGCVVHPIRQAE